MCDNNDDIFEIFFEILIGMNKDYLFFIKYILLNEKVSDLIQSSSGNVLKLKYLVCEILKKYLFMFKKVLETMNIKGNNKSELIQNLQKISKNDIISRIQNTVQNIIQPAINDIKIFEN